MQLIAWLIKIVIFIVLLGFALGNTEVVHLGVFGKQEVGFDAPLVVFLLGFFALGMIVGLLTLAPRVMRQRRQVKRLRRDVERLQEKLGHVSDDATLIGSRLALRYGAGFVRHAFILVVGALILKTGWNALKTLY